MFHRRSIFRRSAFAALLGALVSLAPVHSQQEGAPPALGLLMQALSKTEDPSTQLNLLRGINAALKGRRNVPAPPEWAALAEKLGNSENAELKEQVQTLGAVFGSSGAFEAMRRIVADTNADRAAREKALESLVAGRDKDTVPLLLELITAPGPLRRAAFRGLAAFEDERIPAAVLSAYPTLDTEEKRDALGTLLSRPASARALVAALEGGQVAATDLSTSQIRQLRDLKDPQVDAWLQKNPALMVSSANKQAEIAKYKEFLTPEFVRAGDLNRGRAFFGQICASCHVLFGTGGTVGPEITGANRTDIDYLLQNIVDPNAFIGKDYQSTTVETKDGRVVVGMIRGDDANTLTIKTLADSVIIPRSDVKNVAVSEVSMMPEGLLSVFKQDEVRDLFAYLASAKQVPMLASEITAADFFNGSDLSRWRPSAAEAWRVADGVIIGTGEANSARSLISDMVADDFRFTAQLRTVGANAAAEFAFSGMPADASFKGLSLSFGGNAPVNVWRYVGEKPEHLGSTFVLHPHDWNKCEVVNKGGKIRVLLNDKPVFELPSPTRRSGFAFYLRGEGAELQIKDAKLEVLPP